MQGNTAFGILNDSLIVCLGSRDKAEKLIAAGEAEPFDVTGCPMEGWVMVAKGSFDSAPETRRWVDMGLAFAKTLPPRDTSLIY